MERGRLSEGGEAVLLMSTQAAPEWIESWYGRRQEWAFDSEVAEDVLIIGFG